MNRKIEGVTWGIKLMQLPPPKEPPIFQTVSTLVAKNSSTRCRHCKLKLFKN